MTKQSQGFWQPRILIGIFLIAFGAMLILENLGFIYNFNLWEWWPLILIFAGIHQFTKPGKEKNYIGALVLIGLGLIFLGNNLNWFDVHIWDFWPVIIILVGLGMIRRTGMEGKNIQNSDYLHLSYILGGANVQNTSRNLKGGNITAVMGGADIDLTGAEIDGDEMKLDTFAFWGGISIKIPETWQVELRATPILGGIDNETRGDADKVKKVQARKRLIITGTIIMGGLEIKN